MIRHLFILLTVALLIACKSDSASNSEDVAIESDQNGSRTQIPVEGNWLNEKYYNSIKFGKSPRDAQKTCEVCFIKIPSETNKMAEVVINFHEAIEYLLVGQEDNHFQLWESENNKPVRMVDSIIIKSANKIKIGKDAFVRTKALDDGQQVKILEQLLFKGNYLSEAGTEVHFNKNGEVSGLGDYKYYEPIMDYNDVGRDVDQIKLGTKKDNMEAFAFKFKKKKLQIFSLHCLSKDDSGNCAEVSFGDQLFGLKVVK